MLGIPNRCLQHAGQFARRSPRAPRAKSCCSAARPSKRPSGWRKCLRLIDVPEAAAGIDGSPQLEVYSLTSGGSGCGRRCTQKICSATIRHVSISSDDDNGFHRCHRDAVAAGDDSRHDRPDAEGAAAGRCDCSSPSVDPQIAVLAINKLFGGTGDEAGSESSARRRRHRSRRASWSAAPPTRSPKFAVCCERWAKRRGRRQSARQFQAARSAAADDRCGRPFGDHADRTDLAVRAQQSHSHRDAHHDDSDLPPERDAGRERRRPAAGPAAAGAPSGSAQDLWQIFLNRNRTVVPPKPEPSRPKKNRAMKTTAHRISQPKTSAPVVAAVESTSPTRTKTCSASWPKK